MLQSILARYGFAHVNLTPPLVDEEDNLLFPHPRPLYSAKQDGHNAVVEHGKWCVARALYPENVARIEAIIRASTK